MRWYDRPHDGAHATDVTANVLGASGSPPAAAVAPSALDEDAGVGFRDRSVDGRREGETWMICTRRALGMWATREKAGRAHLDDAVDPTSCGDDLAPIFVLTP